MDDIRINKEKVLEFHNMLIERTGGDPGVRDEALLESAVNAPFQTFMDRDLYYGMFDQGAALAYYIINNHPFVDGNKRIGMFAMLTFMEINRWGIFTTWEEVARVGWAIAKGEMGIEHISAWLHANSELIMPEMENN